MTTAQERELVLIDLVGVLSGAPSWRGSASRAAVTTSASIDGMVTSCGRVESYGLRSALASAPKSLSSEAISYAWTAQRRPIARISEESQSEVCIAVTR
jgi:hypothetical protein